MNWDHPRIQAHIKEHLERSGLFAPTAELTVQDGTNGAIRVSCSWPLENDPEQPEKRSTPIEIVLKGSVADLFRSARGERLTRLDEALARVVARRMKRYRADHSFPFHRSPPLFKIRIDRLGLDQQTG